MLSALNVFNFAGEPSAGIVHAETLSLWRRASLQDRRRTLSLFSACGSADAWSVPRILFGMDDLLAVLGAWQLWPAERLANSSVWNRRLSRCFGRVATLTRGASGEFCLANALSLFCSGGTAGAHCPESAAKVFVKTTLPCLHHSTHTGHIGRIRRTYTTSTTPQQYTMAPTPPTYTTARPQHQTRRPCHHRTDCFRDNRGRITICIMNIVTTKTT